MFVFLIAIIKANTTVLCPHVLVRHSKSRGENVLKLQLQIDILLSYSLGSRQYGTVETI